MLSRARSFINLEENLSTQFDNPVNTDANSSRPEGNESHLQKVESDRGTHGRYDKYTLFNASKENIYQEGANTEF